MEELCPDVTFLQYVNPMAMNCWAIDRATSIKTVGLCHSVQGTAVQLAADIGVPIEEINYVCAGINHMAFYLTFERDGEDLYPEIRQVIEEGRVPDWNRVRYEMLKRLGYFVTESSEHFAEYVPWFIKRDRPDLIEEFNVPLDEYIRRCELQIAGWDFMRRKLEDPELDLLDEFVAAMKDAGIAEEHVPLIVDNFNNVNKVERSHEYGSRHHPQHGDRRAARGLRQRAQQRPHRQSARRAAAWKCPVWSTRMASSRPRSARCRRIWPRSCRPTSTCSR